jgi:hypothetical protein
MRILAQVDASEPVRCEVVGSTGAVFAFTKVGHARFALAGEQLGPPACLERGVRRRSPRLLADRDPRERDPTGVA